MAIIAPMMKRALLAISGLLLILGGFAHAAAFRKAVSAIDGAVNLSPFFANDFKVLWLGDSATLLVVGALFVAAVVRPGILSRFALVMLALIPAATGLLIYRFVGNFYAGHLLLIAALIAVAAAAPPFARAHRSSSAAPA